MHGDKDGRMQAMTPKHNPKACVPEATGVSGELKKCKISVYVNDCDEYGGVSTVPDFVSSFETVDIEWTIETKGYDFTSNGIEFDDKSEFDDLRIKDNKAKIRNKHTPPSSGGKKDVDYKYTVNVKPKKSITACKEQDPWIRNSF